MHQTFVYVMCVCRMAKTTVRLSFCEASYSYKVPFVSEYLYIATFVNILLGKVMVSG